MEKMISIIIPFYCTPIALFQRCIESVLIGNDAIEVIVVDDGSPQEYQNVLKQVVTNTDIHVIYASHEGVSAARNRGVSEARGRWISFVDSDDFVDQDTFRRIVNQISSFEGDIELFNGGLSTNGTTIRNTSFLREHYNYAEKQEDKLKVMESALSAGILPRGYVQNFSYGSPYCKLFNRDFLISNQLSFDKSVKFAEDALFLLSAYIKANKVYYHDWHFYNYVDNKQSVTRKYRPGISRDMDVFFEKTKKMLIQNGLFSDLEKAYFLRAEFEVDRSFYLEFFNLQNKDKRARKEFKEFIRKEPYQTALLKEYLPRENYRQRIFRFLVKKGYGNIYKTILKMKA